MILVTGGTGLVGAHLLIELCKNSTTGIVAIYRSTSKKEHIKSLFYQNFEQQKAFQLFNTISWELADITDVPSLTSIFKKYAFDVVYHCAGFISFIPSDFNQLKKVNIEGTANLINLSIDFSISKFCYVSSIATLNKTPYESVITEKSNWNSEYDNSGYAISKYGGEMEVWRGAEEGLNVVIVNPGVIIGNGFTTGSSELFLKVKKGMPFYTKGKTGYVSVKDVAQVMIQLIERNIVNEKFILVAKNLSHKEVISMISKIIKKAPPKYEIPRAVVNFISNFEALLAICFKRKPKIPKDMVTSLFSEETYNSDKLKKALNYNFESIEASLKKTATSFS